MQRTSIFLISYFLFLFLCFNSAYPQLKTSELDFAQKLYDDGLYLLAADQYREYVLKHPESPLAAQARHMIAESFFTYGDLDQAERAYRDFLQQYSQHPLAPGAWCRLGECLFHLGQFGDAIVAYDRSRQMEPEGSWVSQALFGMAQALRHDGQVRRALQELDAFAKEYPQDVQIYAVHSARGEILAAWGRMDEARAAYQAAARVASAREDRSRAIYREGLILVHGEQTEEAMIILARLVESDSVSLYADSALALLGDLSLEAGQYLQAAQVFGALNQRAEDAELSERGGLRQAEALRLAGDPAAAITVYRQWLYNHPQSPMVSKARLGLAASLRQKGQLDSAAVVLEELTIWFMEVPEVRDAWLQLGDLRRQMGQGERALTSYRRFLDRYPQDPQSDSVFFLTAQIQEDLGRPQAALRAYEEFSSLYPHSRWDDEADFAVGRLLEAGGEYQQALRAYQVFAQERPLSPLYPAAQKRIYYLNAFRVPEEPLALEAMVDIQDQLASKRMSDQEVDLRLAEIYLRHLRNFDRAASALERFLINHPASSLADQALYQLSQCHYRQAEMLRMDGDSIGAVREMEAAAGACRQLLRDVPNSQLADRCALEVIAEVFRGQAAGGRQSWQDRVDLYSSFLRTYPDSHLRPFALLRIGESLLELAEADTVYLARADSVLSLVIQRHHQSAWADTAAWLRIGITHKQGGDGVALVASRDFLWDFPDSPLRSQVLFFQAQIHGHRGEHQQAAKLFRSVAEDFPYHGLTEEARLAWARSLWAGGEREGAVQILKVFDQLYPESSLWMKSTLLQAQYAAAKGEKEQIRTLVAQLERAAGDGRLELGDQLSLGDLYLELGAIDKALDRYRMVLEGDVHGSLVPTILEKMAQASFAATHYAKAQNYYEQALAQSHDEDIKTLLESQRIICLYRQELIKEARQACKEFTKRHGDEPELIAELLMEEGLAELETGEEGSARKAFEQVMATVPEGHLAQEADYRLGLMELSSGEYQKARERFTSLLERYPETELRDLVLFKMASTLYALEQYPEAARYYRQAAGVTADQNLKVDALFNAGICRARMNDWEGAIAIYRQLLGDFPDHGDRQTWSLRLGFAYLESDQPARALETFLGIDPGPDSELGAEVQFWVGECYFKMDQYETAAQEYLRVGFLYPQQDQWATTAEYNAGVCYEKLGRIDEARTIFRKLVKTRAADDQWSQMAQERLTALGD